MSREAFTYIDRRTGQAKTDPIVAGAFLDWCYNTPVGRRVTRAVLSRKFVSRIYGWYYRQPWTRCRVEAFASSLGVNLNELTQPLASFRSVAEFFSRDIDLSKRRIDPEPDACVSPADGLSGR